MAQYLTYKSAHLFLKLSKICYLTESINWSQFLERLALLKTMCSPKNPSGVYAERVLSLEKFELNDEWFDEPESFFNSTNHKFRKVESELKSTMGKDNQPCLHFCPGTHTKLSSWEFHQYDDDFYPSIPHGHLHRQSQPNLDSYNGWIYQNNKRGKREPRKSIVALWNDEKFRAFATQAIQYYLDKHPKYTWRVEQPFRLPRRRK
jgi:hypothetical protein